MKNLKKGLFPFLIALSALSVSTSAAFYSVYGLSKLFAGAQFEVIIMAGSLEVAKLVTASLLYQYWGTINKALRTYLTVATVVLVLITSMGIYGFLSSAYQDTYRQLIMKENQTSFLIQKKDFYKVDVNRYDEELKRISDNIGVLSNARSQQIQVRDTSVAGGVRTTISTSELRLAAKRIETEEENRKKVQNKREIAADSLQTYQLKILELENNFDVAGELGPLQYLSGLTGYPMDKIINILLLVIIFVFDPLAISLVIAANFAFNKAYPKRLKNLYGEAVEEALGVKKKENSKLVENEKRMNIVGQNGNDGLHYDNEWAADKDVEEFLERADQQGPWDKEDDKSHLVAGMTNDKEGSFMKFQQNQELNDSNQIISGSAIIEKVIVKKGTQKKVLLKDGSKKWINNDQIDKEDPNKIIYF